MWHWGDIWGWQRWTESWLPPWREGRIYKGNYKYQRLWTPWTVDTRGKHPWLTAAVAPFCCPLLGSNGLQPRFSRMGIDPSWLSVQFLSNAPPFCNIFFFSPPRLHASSGTSFYIVCIISGPLAAAVLWPMRRAVCKSFHTSRGGVCAGRKPCSVFCSHLLALK